MALGWTLFWLQITTEWVGVTEQPRSHKDPHATGIASYRDSGGGGHCRHESPKQDSRCPWYLQEWEKPEPTNWGAQPGSWSLCWSMRSRLSNRRSTWALIWLSSPLMECSSSVWTVERGPRVGVPTGPGDRGQWCQTPRLALTAREQPTPPLPCR